jgi:hypothetical protein
MSMVQINEEEIVLKDITNAKLTPGMGVRRYARVIPGGILLCYWFLSSAYMAD